MLRQLFYVPPFKQSKTINRSIDYSADPIAQRIQCRMGLSPPSVNAFRVIISFKSAFTEKLKIHQKAIIRRGRRDALLNKSTIKLRFIGI